MGILFAKSIEEQMNSGFRSPSGQPAFTTGACIWNSENYTTTLTLDASSTAELNWNTYNITTFSDAHSSISSSNVTVGLAEVKPSTLTLLWGTGLTSQLTVFRKDRSAATCLVT
jgi:hypothetical protein